MLPIAMHCMKLISSRLTCFVIDKKLKKETFAYRKCWIMIIILIDSVEVTE